MPSITAQFLRYTGESLNKEFAPSLSRPREIPVRRTTCSEVSWNAFLKQYAFLFDVDKKLRCIFLLRTKMLQDKNSQNTHRNLFLKAFLL